MERQHQLVRFLPFTALLKVETGSESDQSRNQNSKRTYHSTLSRTRNSFKTAFRTNSKTERKDSKLSHSIHHLKCQWLHFWTTWNKWWKNCKFQIAKHHYLLEIRGLHLWGRFRVGRWPWVILGRIVLRWSRRCRIWSLGRCCIISKRMGRRRFMEMRLVLRRKFSWRRFWMIWISLLRERINRSKITL